MNSLTFVLVSAVVMIYLCINIFTTYKIVCLNSERNLLSVKSLNNIDFLFRISLISMSILFLVFSMFFIPKTFSLYNEVVIQMVVYIVGISLLYELSSKSLKDLFNINLIVVTTNFMMILIPQIILFIAINA